jgi:peptidoglycan/xylan/chitin deacetylase (PgdA/CDA1 family)
MQHSALMYHDVGSAGATGGPDTGIRDRYTLTWDAFAAHLDAIAARERQPPAASEAVGSLDGGWSLTFDDGGASAPAVGDELVRRGWRGYFFVTTGLVGTPGFIDAEGVRELDRQGHVIGSHSVTHPPRFASLAPDAMDAEWRDSLAALAEMVGHPIRSASVPGGDFRRPVAAAAARAGITLLFTSEPSRSVAERDGCAVIGRYSIVAATGSAEAAAAAAGDRRRWLQQAVGWNARKVAKRIGGRRYDALRRRVLSERRTG